MKRAIFFLFTLLAIAGCTTDSGLTDLTPDDGVGFDFAFNVPLLNQVISRDTAVVDTGWYEVTRAPIYVPSPFEQNIRYITTDTFAFQWQDYALVTAAIHKVANGFDITNTTVLSRYGWLNYSNMYSSSESYLIPLFNRAGQRYWLEVFREKQSFWMTRYTARGVWAISETRPIEGDVS